jgi:hypothetical protein
MSPLSMSLGTSAAHGAIVPLGSYTVKSTSVGEVVFSSIPTGYQDLYITANVYGAVEGEAFPYAYFVSYGTGLSATTVIGNNGTGTSNRQTGAGSITGYQGEYLSGLHPTTVEMHILNYANTSTQKTILIKSGTDKNNWGTTLLNATLIQSTAAVQLVDFATFTGASNFGVGSTFNLYGVRSIGQ